MKKQLCSQLAIRFWAKVDTSGECWLWIAAMRNGYGAFRHEKKIRRAHIIAWEFEHGKVPKGHYVLHNCPGGDNRACVREAHLWLGTHADNMKDAFKKHRLPLPLKVGEQHWNAKLTATQVATMRQRYSEGGITQKVLAAQFNISHQEAGFILTNRRWKRPHNEGEQQR
jgi:hypothetical protein